MCANRFICYFGLRNKFDIFNIIKKHYKTFFNVKVRKKVFFIYFITPIEHVKNYFNGNKIFCFIPTSFLRKLSCSTKKMVKKIQREITFILGDLFSIFI